MKLKERISNAIAFVGGGVWHSTKNTVKVRIVKTLNLAVTSFMDRDVQDKAASLTFYTLLALVPALALIFAIGRGFGLQDLITDQLFDYFPAQQKAIETAIHFVDSYLNQASQGVFVGIGVLVLLYTLISLLSSIEDAFNAIWGLKKERSIFQKVTDYIAICLLVPVLMICSSGVSIFVSSELQSNIHIPFITPLINWILELSPIILAWLAFTLSFLLIPNTKVKFKYAAISGAVSAIGFQIIELLLLNGQIYVTKYNAIYGSFAFVPLLLVWLQLSWMILLAGCTLSYSLQNVFAYNYMADTNNISTDYMRKVTLVVAVVVCSRFDKGESPLTCGQLAQKYNLPMRLVSNIADRMQAAKLINFIALDDNTVGLAPAIDTSKFSVGHLFKSLDALGDSDFIPGFNENYPDVNAEMERWNLAEWTEPDRILLRDIPVSMPKVADSPKEGAKEAKN